LQLADPRPRASRVGRAADVEAFIRSHVYKPDYKKLVTPQQSLVGVADGYGATGRLDNLCVLPPGCPRV